MFKRTIKLKTTNSHFLFGPRGTGKTTLLKSLYQEEKVLYIDLLSPVEEDIFARKPDELEQRISAIPGSCKQVIIDEIQKVPKLLDVIHGLIENTNIQFILTGSSARKLKRGGSNLLAGRAFVFNLFALTHHEIGKSFNLIKALRWGTLPRIYQLSKSTDKAEFLKAYVLTYLNEEIKAEQIIRKLDPFRQFLEVAAQSNAKIINYSKIADDVGVDIKTIQSYFSILEDTLIGIILPAFHKSVRKRQMSNPKFYLFDTGAKRALERTLTVDIQEGTYEFGNLFETFIINEIIRLNSYARKDWQFYYLKTGGGVEVDIVIERPGKPLALIEIKSASSISRRDIKGLQQISRDLKPCCAYCFSRDIHRKKIDDVMCLPWEKGIKELGL